MDAEDTLKSDPWEKADYHKTPSDRKRGTYLVAMQELYPDIFNRDEDLVLNWYSDMELDVGRSAASIEPIDPSFDAYDVAMKAIKKKMLQLASFPPSEIPFVHRDVYNEAKEIAEAKPTKCDPVDHQVIISSLLKDPLCKKYFQGRQLVVVLGNAHDLLKKSPHEVVMEIQAIRQAEDRFVRSWTNSLRTLKDVVCKRGVLYHMDESYKTHSMGIDGSAMPIYTDWRKQNQRELVAAENDIFKLVGVSRSDDLDGWAVAGFSHPAKKIWNGIEDYEVSTEGAVATMSNLFESAKNDK